jgi:excinuclease ABC subunit C
MNKKIKDIIKTIPHSPGCYRYFNSKGELIYIGKAKDLKKRVYSYFVGANDAKTTVLVQNIADIKWEVAESEIEALILESLLIKKYKPKFNIKIKDDKDFLWVKIDMGMDFPMPELVRPFFAKAPKGKPTRGKIKYFGPFTDSKLIKQGLIVLRKIFLWRDCSSSKFSFYKKKGKPCLEYYIKNCSAPCQIGDNCSQLGTIINKDEYLLGIKQLVSFLNGGKKSIAKTFEKEMARLAKGKKFEEAAFYRDRLRALQHMDTVLKFQNSNNKFQTNTKYPISNIKYLQGFLKVLNNDLDYDLKFKKDFRIEFYDISNISGKEAVGSMVTCRGDKFDKNSYRKFKIRTVSGINDYKMMEEVLRRRIKRVDWTFPDLIVLDGGKGQLGIIQRLFWENKIDIPLVSLAKREEEVFGVKEGKFKKTSIRKDSPEGFFVQRLRDEAHRFAIGYHKILREKKSISSRLDLIDGIGPVMKKKLLLKFGSVDGIIKSSAEDIAKIVGNKMATKLKEKL